MNEPNEREQAATPTPAPSAEESLAKIAAELTAIRAALDTVAQSFAVYEARRALNPLCRF